MCINYSKCCINDQNNYVCNHIHEYIRFLSKLGFAGFRILYIIILSARHMYVPQI